MSLLCPAADGSTQRAGVGVAEHTEDAGRALLAALTVPSGVYNVCRDGERVSNQRFIAASGWHAAR